MPFSQTFFVILQAYFAMRDYISEIRRPIEKELEQFTQMFQQALSHADGTLEHALNYILQRTGKRMRPMLTLLIAKNYGEVTAETYRAGVGLELLHTASLVHDDVVDEADKRRGQNSLNSVYGNQMAVLIGDYILSTALLNVAQTNNTEIVKCLSELGQTLSNGEILQLTSNASDEISEEAYFSIIGQKTAALFEACCAMSAMSVGASKEDVTEARLFGRKLGTIFQIRDDIFDYYESKKVGKPTGNDMAEGKLTLPAIYALLSTNDSTMRDIAQRVKSRCATPEEIANLISFTKENGGIEYAEKVMHTLRKDAQRYIDERVGDNDLKQSLTAYLDYIIERSI